MYSRTWIIIWFLGIACYSAGAQDLRIAVLDTMVIGKSDLKDLPLRYQLFGDTAQPTKTEAIDPENVSVYHKKKRIPLKSLQAKDPDISGLIVLEVLDSKTTGGRNSSFYTKLIISSQNKRKPLPHNDLGHNHEIILQDNPYTASYGELIRALLTYGGRPLANSTATLHIKTKFGNHINQQIKSDAEGIFYVNMSLEGTYHIQHFMPEGQNNEDNSYSTLAFEFINNIYIRHDYRSFGLQ